MTLESIETVEARDSRGAAQPSSALHAWDSFIAAVGGGVASLSRSVGAGGGTSAPGLVIERLDPGFVRRRAQSLARTTTVVSGTNGKTTTAAMLATILDARGTRVLTNASGANLFRGVAAALASAAGDEQAAVFEVDEAALPRVVRASEPAVLVLTNVFRDQLDRFAEPEIVARLLRESAEALPPGSIIVANADDPLLWHAVEDLHPIGFGIQAATPTRTPTTTRREADPEICPRCGAALRYLQRTFAHLGVIRCPACGWASARPAFRVTVEDDGRLDRLRLSIDGVSRELMLGGQHNAYNAAAAIAVASSLGIAPSASIDALGSFVPRFGRSERLSFDERSFWVFLAKNPVSCVTATRQVASDPRIRAAVVLINDRAADGRDVSWIWDAGLEELLGLDIPVFAGGERAHDIALRFRYAGGTVDAVDPDLDALLTRVGAVTRPGDNVAVLATYTAMLAFRRAVLGSRSAGVSDTVRDRTEPVLR
ncbi:MAG TPA: MurT ligase domain-containing protein [Actinomycetota bacterium]|nr:MurT ligase domain-containing protein [Actinomycetota bacterium]